MIEEKPPQAISLFDLIGRDWRLDRTVTQIAFSASGLAVACGLGDGRLALIQVADTEHPDKRVRTELDTGRMSIRPRENALPVPRLTDPLMPADAPGFCRLGADGFAVAHDGGEVWRVTARAQALRLVGRGEPVTALCACPASGGLFIARGPELQQFSKDGTGQQKLTLSCPARHLVLSADGRRLVAWGGGRFSILTTEPLQVTSVLDHDDAVLGLAWSPDGRWIAAGSDDRTLILIDADTARMDSIVGFPGPVADVAFSRAAGALMASGAFRLVGWRGPDLPFGDHTGNPIGTGRAGLTLADRIALHPLRDLCAVAWGNGLVTLSQIGSKDELMLSEGRGVPVTSLAWSDDGAHLALGHADGRAAIVTFPKAMFR